MSKLAVQVLLVGLASVHTGWGILQREVCGSLAAMYVDSHPNSSLVLHRIWPVNQVICLPFSTVLPRPLYPRLLLCSPPK